MRLISVGFGKAKAVQCYVSLLIWLILVSVGLYWYLNRTGTSLSVLTQTGFGYNDILSDPEASRDESKDSFESNKNPVAAKDNGEEATVKASSHKTFTSHHDYGPNTYSKSLQSEGQEESNSKGNDIGNTEESLASDVNRLCNPVESIKSNDENIQVADYKLEAVIVLFRHGDRGPLTHIGHRNVSHINCEAKSSELDHLTKFATETILKLPGYSQFIGAFHSFPRVPSSHYCSLGQLSQLGSAQLLTLGRMIRSTYKSTLVNFTSLNGVHDPHPLKVIAYSTRYRRTFQSLFAFLFGLLGPKHLIQSTTIRESQSITFCFNHCSCRAADRLKKSATKKYQPSPDQKVAMSMLVNQLNSVLGTDKSKKTGNSLLDSLLVYPCHKIELPCHEDNHKDRGVKLIYKAIKKLSFNPQTSGSDSSCISLENLNSLIKLIKTETRSLKKIAENRHYHLLSSYGLLKEIVNAALKMTSSDSPNKKQSSSFSAASSLSSSSMSANNRNYFGKGVDSKTKIILYSGHDTTLQSLTAALGIFSGHPDIQLPPFSSRLIFEFYRRTNVPPNSPRKHYFRVIYNGISVTHLVSFCKESSSNNNNKTEKEGNVKKTKYYYKTLFCPLENLVRFMHDHYFDSFLNATNFKDACQL